MNVINYNPLKQSAISNNVKEPFFIYIHLIILMILALNETQQDIKVKHILVFIEFSHFSCKNFDNPTRTT